MSRSLWSPSLAFGALSVLSCAAFVGVVGLLILLFGAALLGQSVPGIRPEPSGLASAALLGVAGLYGWMFVVFCSVLFAAPCGAAASVLFYVCATFLSKVNAPKVLYIPVGGICGLLGTGSVYWPLFGSSFNSSSLILGASFGLASSLVLLYLPCLRPVSSVLKPRPSEVRRD
jgi:hypothetical protein